MFVCLASHKSAEPNTLVVMMDFADRDALVEDDPDTYYLKEHYLNYPCVLVRLSRVRADALRDLVTGAHGFVSAKAAEEVGGQEPTSSSGSAITRSLTFVLVVTQRLRRLNPQRPTGGQVAGRERDQRKAGGDGQQCGRI